MPKSKATQLSGGGIKRDERTGRFCRGPHEHRHIDDLVVSAAAGGLDFVQLVDWFGQRLVKA